jgi:hypothetical protein
MIAAILGLDATGVQEVIAAATYRLPAFLKRALHS